MSRCCWGLALILSFGLMGSSAEAQQFGAIYSPRALCVTDPYGAQFHNWYGSPIAFNSYFYMQSGAGYSSGFNGATSGFFGGGVPAVASATTSEWVVQRTSIFPIGTYIPWVAYPAASAAPWNPGIGRQQRRPISQLRDDHDLDLPATRDTDVRQASGTLPSRDNRGQHALAEGDRLLREGQNRKAYMEYLEAQRVLGTDGDVYFRQAFALIALGRYSHAIAKLKRGLQVEPDYPQHGATLDEVFGTDNTDQKDEYLQQVASWADADASDPDRLFLKGVLLHFDEDPRASAVFNAAWKLAGRGPHLQAFLQSPPFARFD